MHRGLTIALILVVMMLGAASAKLFLGPRGTAEVPPAATSPAAGDPAQPPTAADIAGREAPDGATTASTPGSSIDVAEPKPVPSSSRSVAVPPAPSADAVSRRASSVRPTDAKPERAPSPPASPPPARPAPAQPVPVSPAPTPNRPAGEAPRAASTSDESAALTPELRRELIRRYLEALSHLRD